MNLTQAFQSQENYIEKIKEYNNVYLQKNGSPRKMFISTFGCQMNAHDSEKLQGMLSQMGYETAESEQEADIIVYNTCCIRENAENKVYGNLGYLKNMKAKKPDLKIILCGCMMQQDSVISTIKEKYRHVNLIFGTFNLHRFPELLNTAIESNSLIIDVWKEHTDIVEDLPVERKYKFKSSVNIMYGCDNYCSYCIVPYVRGRERSRKPEDIVAEIKNLVADGIIEVCLLGQNVNSYGKEHGITFAQLLREINKIDGLERIRFMTSHPKDLSDELIEAIKDCQKICKHIHLPLQSGSSEILKKMNRKYTREHYCELVTKLRKSIPDIAITTDIIVGFPGETEEDFAETVDIIKEVKFSSAFTFQFSKRTGTPAAKMDEQIPQDTVTDRFNRLLDELKPISAQCNQSMVGTVQKVLPEEINKQNPELLTGRTDNNSLVHFKADPSLIGKPVDVKITGCKTFYLIGEKI